jgi:predicted transcriptional regulator
MQGISPRWLLRLLPWVQTSGRPLGALANDALRDFVRYENQVVAAIDRGISDLEAGRTRTTEEVFALLEQQRLARTRG